MKNTMGLISTNYTTGDFGGLTDERPEASLPFGGRYRLIDFQISNLVNSGIKVVGLITPYMYRSLLDHVGDGKEWSFGRKVGGLYILPGSPFGLQGPRGKLLMRDFLINRAYLERGGCKNVLVCDSSKVMNIDYSEVIEEHDSSGNDITFIYKEGLYTQGDTERCLSLSSDGRVLDITGMGKEPNCFVGAFVINLNTMLRLMKMYENVGYADLMHVIKNELGVLKTGSYMFTGYVGLVNDLTSYMQTSMDLLRSDVRSQLFPEGRPVRTKVQDSPPANYVAGCDVSSSLIASGCVIEGNVENSIIFRDVRVERGAVIRNCVLMQHCRIGENAVMENIICDKYVTVRSGVQFSANPNSPIVITKRDTL